MITTWGSAGEESLQGAFTIALHVSFLFPIVIFVFYSDVRIVTLSLEQGVSAETLPEDALATFYSDFTQLRFKILDSHITTLKKLNIWSKKQEFIPLTNALCWRAMNDSSDEMEQLGNPDFAN